MKLQMTLMKEHNAMSVVWYVNLKRYTRRHGQKDRMSMAPTDYRYPLLIVMLIPNIDYKWFD